MPRNFDRRVEVMFPVEAEDLRWRIVEEIIPAYLRDNRRARVLLADGSYARPEQGEPDNAHRSQVELLSAATVRKPAAPPDPLPSPVATPAAVAEVAVESNGAPERDKKKKKEKGQEERRAPR